MEMYVEKGESRMDCEMKIASKYKRPFKILSQKEIRTGGFLGFFSKPGVEVEFYFSPQQFKKTIVLDQTEDGLEVEKRKVLAAAGKNYDQIVANGREASQQILDTLKELKEKIEVGGAFHEDPRKKKTENISITRAVELLRKNDFSEIFINEMIEKMRKEFSLETLENFDAVQEQLVEWIGESIVIYKEEEIYHKPRIFIIVGPTGVGKTTTIAKLAAFYGIGTEELPAIDVRMITIDAFRICAKEQLETIGNIMQIPVSCVDNKQALRKEIAVHKDIDMYFIDTIGRSPKDASGIGLMKEILDGAGRNAEFHLALSAATKTKDIENILRQFEPFNYKSVILTKMDETEHLGNVISALAEKRKSISYITDGQTLPSDIARASVVRFLINLDGFKINREKIDKRFPSGDADQFKWK